MIRSLSAADYSAIFQQYDEKKKKKKWNVYFESAQTF